MTLVKYDPFCGLSPARSRLFDGLFSAPLSRAYEEPESSQWAPAVDIKEDEQGFLVQADIPGVDPKNIEVTFERGVLTIQGTRSADHQETRDGYHRIERSVGSFIRRFSLPDSIDEEGIEAKGKDGVLEIRIPRLEQKTAKKIEVQ